MKRISSGSMTVEVAKPVAAPMVEPQSVTRPSNISKYLFHASCPENCKRNKD